MQRKGWDYYLKSYTKITKIKIGLRSKYKTSNSNTPRRKCRIKNHWIWIW